MDNDWLRDNGVPMGAGGGGRKEEEERQSGDAKASIVSGKQKNRK